MRKVSGVLPPRYFQLLKLSLIGALLRLIPWIPFCLAYFLPLGVWSNLLIVFWPVLWYMVVEPVRIHFGAMLRALVKDPAAPLEVNKLFTVSRTWQSVPLGRVQLSWRYVLPFALLSLLLAVALLSTNVFTALNNILHVFIWIASAAATMAEFIPRLLMGESAVVDAGVLGGGIALLAAFVITFCWMIWGLFQTSGYRYGFTRMPRIEDIKALCKKNLLLFLPALVSLLVLLVFSYQEGLFILSNILSVAPVYTIKLSPLHLVLTGVTVVLYFIFLPVRKWNTAKWATDRS